MVALQLTACTLRGIDPMRVTRITIMPVMECSVNNCGCAYQRCPHRGQPLNVKHLVADLVEVITGIPAMTVEQFTAANRAAFAGPGQERSWEQLHDKQSR